MISDNDADGEYALDFLMIAKYFERIGAHAVDRFLNIRRYDTDFSNDLMC